MSDRWKWSTFYLERAEEYLQLADLATGDLKKACVRLAESYKSIADGERKITEIVPRATVLIVEDDASFGYAASRYLGNAGFGTIVAPGSMAALAELESTRIDAAIIDLCLNDGEPQGLSLGRMIGAKSPLVRVILMTAYPDLLAGEIALPGPVLYKPIEPSDLCREVIAGLELASAPRDPLNATVSGFSKDGSGVKDAVVMVKNPKLDV